MAALYPTRAAFSYTTAGDTIVDLSKMSGDRLEAIEDARVIIRDRHMEMINMNRLKAGEVVERLTAIWPDFTMHHHVLAWRYHGIRPRRDASDPARTEAKYCVYDRAHRDYLYTDAWVSKLEAELREGGGAAISRWIGSVPSESH